MRSDSTVSTPARSAIAAASSPKSEAEPGREAAGDVGHELGRSDRRHARDPRRRGIGCPFADETHGGVDQLVGEAVVVIRGPLHHAAPAAVAVDAEGTTGPELAIG